MIKIYDFFGKEIKEGDFIVYGYNVGRCAALKFGKVLSIKAEASENWRKMDVAIRVQGVQYGKLGGKGTLMYPERTLVVDYKEVPEEIKKLYD